MKIAVFYPSEGTAWSITKGVCSALSRMGHEVLDCNEHFGDSLEEQNLIFVSGPEYLWRSIRDKYPLWDKLSMPKVGWLHETVEREDYDTNRIAVDGKLPVEELKKFTPHLFTPAVQDQKHGMQFLPCGVDTKMFHPRGKSIWCDSIYTGSIYKKRRAVLEAYPEIRTLSGYRDYATVEEYAMAIANASVVLILPSLTEASNARTFEVLASRTALIAPFMIFPDTLFSHGKHLMFYQGNPAKCFEEMTPSMAEKLAQRGYEEVMENHTIEHRLKKVLSLTIRPLRFSRKR